MSDLRLVGFEELAAGVLRVRLLAAVDDFWAGARLDREEIRGRHDPVFFHQFGGFGAVALTEDDRDAGYLLGVVTADGLAVVHALAVRRDHRRRGLATRLLAGFAELATGCGARAVQAVVPPDDDAVAALAARFGAHAAPSPDHAGPGADRVILTSGLTRA